MEDTVSIPLYVEFYGLPGCGKSTVSHQVANLLRANGYSVCEPSYELDHHHSPLFRKVKKLSVVIYYWLFHHGRYQIVSDIVGDNGYKGVSRIEQISNILQKAMVYQSPINSQIVIWDQGLVQAAISLSLTGRVNASVNLERVNSISSPQTNSLYIFIDVKERVALERMAARTTNYSRIEKLKDEKQKHQMLLRFQESIDSVSTHSKAFLVHGEDSLENQVKQVIKVIQKYY